MINIDIKISLYFLNNTTNDFEKINLKNNRIDRYIFKEYEKTNDLNYFDLNIKIKQT